MQNLRKTRGNLSILLIFACVIIGWQICLADGTPPRQAILTQIAYYKTSGRAGAVQVVGNRAYVSESDAGLQIFDVTNPVQPIPVGRFDTSGDAHGVQVVGNYAYVADWRAGLAIIDVSNPANPIRVGGIDTPDLAGRLHVVGNYAYVADNDSGLQVIDVSNPESPSRIGAYSGSRVKDVQVAGNYAYVATDGKGLQIIDVTNPANPVLAGEHGTPGNCYGIRVVGKYAYVTDLSGFLHIFDVSNPASPARVGGIATITVPAGLQVAGNYAYVAVLNRGVQVIDVSNPSSPVSIGGFEPQGPQVDPISILNVDVAGAHVYVADIASTGMKVLAADIRFPQALTFDAPAPTADVLALNTAYPLRATASSGLPVTLRVQSGPAILSNGTITITGGGTVALTAEQAGDADYFPAHEVRQFNLSSATLTPVGRYDIARLVSLHVTGNYAYVGAGPAGLKVIDVSNPANPLLVGSVATTNARTVRVNGNYAYVADDVAGLQIIDVSNPANPVRVGGYGTTRAAGSVDVVEDLAYLADESGLQILDVRNPTSPARVGSFPYLSASGGFNSAVQVARPYVYVRTSDELKVINVSDPTNPTLVGRTWLWGGVGLKVLGNYAYATQTGLHVIDVSDAANPVVVGRYSYTQGFSTYGLDVAGNYVYMTEFVTGLHVLDVSSPEKPVRIAGIETGGTPFSVQAVGEYVYVGADGGLRIYHLSSRFANKLDFTPPSSLAIANGFIALPQTSSSGAAVTYSVVSGPARVDGDRLTFTGAGEVTLRAEQADDGLFVPVNQEWTINIYQLPQTITWTGTTEAILSLNTAYPLGATASSGLPVTLRVESGPAVIADGKITATAPGTVWVTAEQAGDAAYLSVRVTRGFNLRQVALTRVWAGDYGASDLSLALSGNRAYVGGVGGEIVVHDVSDPANPVMLAAYGASGQIFGLQVVGNHLYVASLSNGLEILDVSNPATPVRIGFYPANLIFAVHVVGTYAYVANGDGLNIIDVSDPTLPVRVGGHATFGQALGVDVVDNKAYVTDAAGWLQVIEVSDPTNPVLLGAYQFGDQLEAVQVVGNHAYLAERNIGFQVVDVRNPSNLVPVGGATSLGDAIGLQVLGNYAYVAAGNSGLYVLDISNPADPIRVGGATSGGAAYAVQVAGNYAFVANETYGDGNVAGFQIFKINFAYPNTLDFAPPEEVPFTTGFLTLPETSSNGKPVNYSVLSGPARVDGYRLTFTGTGTVSLRAEQPDDGFFIPVNAEWTFTIYKLPQTITWTGTQRQFLAGDTPFPLGAWASSGLPVTVRVEKGLATLANGMITVSGSGGIAVTAEQAGNDLYAPASVTRTFNVRTAVLTLVGEGATGANSGGLQVVGNYAYVANAGTAEGNWADGGLNVMDVSNPANPLVIGGIVTGGEPRGVRVAGKYAYLAEMEGTRLQVVDVTDPTKPTLVGEVALTGPSSGLDVQGNYAYVANLGVWEGGKFNNSSLDVIDVSDPANPVKVGAYDTTEVGPALGVDVVQGYAYVSVGGYGLEVFDVSDPAHPARVGQVASGGRSGSIVQVAGDDVYLLDQDYYKGKLVVIDARDRAHPAVAGDVGIPAPGLPVGVAAAGQDHVCVAVWNIGLQVFDVANPSAPVFAGGGGNMYAQAVDVGGNYVYLASLGWLQIFNLTFGYSQSLELQLPDQLPFQAQPLQWVAVADSGLPATLSVVSGPATVVNNQLVLNGVGPVTLHAEQPGDGTFLPASMEWIVTVVGPQLGVRQSEGGMELFWASLSGFKLQSAESLDFGSQWKDILASPIEVNGEARVGFEKTLPEQYFRLVKQ